MPFFMEADEAARIMIDGILLLLMMLVFVFFTHIVCLFVGLERNVGEIIYPVPTSILSQALNT